MSTLYGYNDSVWKEIHKFTYTGAPEKFTLQPGTYLFQCHGARGGQNFPTYNTVHSYQYGGLSMGILTLDEETDFYAVVGGNGTDGSTSKVGYGGYNGGGYGGFSYNTNYCNGSGGGGATDIRLNLPEEFEPTGPLPTPGVPDWFEEHEYIDNYGTNSGYFNTGYKAKENTIIEIKVCTTHSLYDAFVFGARNGAANREFCLILNEGVYSDKPQQTSYVHGQYMSYGWTAGWAADPPTIFDIGYLFEEHVYRMSKDGVWVDGELKETIPTQTFQTPGYPIFLFGCNNSGSFQKQFTGKMYYCKIWEGDTLVHHYIPGIDMPLDSNCLFDVVEGKSLQPSAQQFSLGPEIVDTQREQSLLTRIMVAGGGGGGTMMTNQTSIDNSFNCAVGGGIVGGALQINKSLVIYGRYASQTDGHLFGIGQTPGKSTSTTTCCAEGRSGGGGGWYGGYACVYYDQQYSSGNGGGGSGYVLTETSYKPEGYEVPEKFYMRNWYMKAGGAEEPCVIISQLTGDIVAGDVIKYYPVGKGCRTSLPPGTYIFKCWGAHGGTRYSINPNGSNSTPGYSQGTFTTPTSVNAFVHVGGSGLNDSQISTEFINQLCPDLRYNGGGAPGTYGTKMTGHSGGGATDIRINFDSLYARVIVAGGAAGCSYDGYSGGNGGGEIGGVPEAASQGLCPGPGTQTDAQVSLDYPVINGGFGYGGNAGYRDATHVGGAGGGGWYGGSGTMPTNNSTPNKGGAGGSGFVLTPVSIENVPADYLLDETFCLADATTTVGASTLPAGFSKAEIEVVASYQQKVLCRDSDGIKYLDQVNQRWELLQRQELNIAVFTAYGVGTFTSDDGLQDQYEILTWDPTDSVTHIDLNVIPNKQTVQQVTISSLPIKKTYFDLDYDTSLFDVKMAVSRHQAGPNTEIITNVTIDKLVPTDADVKIYYATYLTK